MRPKPRFILLTRKYWFQRWQIFYGVCLLRRIDRS